MAETDMLSKVRKLLAKAEDPACTPAEAAACNDKAAELMTKYGIDMILAYAADPSVTSDRIENRFLDCHPPYITDQNILLYGIAQIYRCQVVDITGSGRMSMVGYTGDLDRVELLFTSLLVQVSLGMAVVPPNSHGGDLRRFRKNYFRGFSHTVIERLRASEARAQRDVPDPNRFALAVRDRQTAVNEEFMRMHPLTRLRRVGMALQSSYRAAGMAAGNQADLGGTRVRHGGARSITAS